MREPSSVKADLKKRAAVVALAVAGFLVLLSLGIPGGASASPDTKTDTYQFNLAPNRYQSWSASIYEAGTITITAQWTGTSELHLFLYGPSQQQPFLDVTATSPMTKTFNVTSQILAAGNEQWRWEVRLGNRNNTQTAVGSASITYPKTLPKINEFKAATRTAYPVLLLQGSGTPMYAAWPSQEFSLNWSLSGVRQDVTLTYGCGAVSPELPAGMGRDCPVSTHSVAGLQSSSERIGDLGQIYTLKAINAHGTTEARMIVLPITLVGYHNAVCIGCAPCYQNCGKTPQATLLGNYLKEVEPKLTSGCIRNNTNLDKFNDPYLRGRMTDDMIQGMKTITLYGNDAYVPNVAAGTICTGNTYARTIKESSTNKYIVMCVAKGANGLTLLHELEHYTDPNTTECRAAWVAQPCYGLAGPPWSSVPDCPR